MYILHIGANDMSEIDYTYTLKYKSGIFIEPIPRVYEDLSNNLNKINNQYNTKYYCYNNLITNINNKLYNFNIYKNTKNNDLGPSSIFTEDSDWPYKNKIIITETIPIYSIRMAEFIIQNKIDISYLENVCIDVQGAELEVLKSFDNFIENIKHLEIEISQKKYYKGQVLFNELNNYLINKKFKLISKIIPIHGNVIYKKYN